VREYGLSIVIVSYNNMEVIEQCLNSIYKYNDIGKNIQVIVVEQSPSNDIYEFLLKNYTQFGTIIIRNENNGFGAGNNRGFEHVSKEYVLFLNPDTILIEPVFKYALDRFIKNDKLGVFGIQLLDKDGNKNLSYNYMINFGLKFILISKIRQINDSNFDGKKMYINGADIFIRSDLFVRIKKFDEKIFMYGEETDICLRALKLGYDIKFFPDKKIIHLEGQSTNKKGVYEKLCKSFVYLGKKYDIRYKSYLQSELIYYVIKLKIQKNLTNDSVILLNDRLNVLRKYII